MSSDPLIRFTPELAAQAVARGRVLEVSSSPDGRLAAVVLRRTTLPTLVLCERSRHGWLAIDWEEEHEAAPRYATGLHRAGESATICFDDAPSRPVLDQRGEHLGFHQAWTTTLSDEEQVAGAENVGVEFTYGSAPHRAMHVRLRVRGEELRTPVRDGIYWYVRWEVRGDDDLDSTTVIDCVYDDTSR